MTTPLNVIYIESNAQLISSLNFFIGRARTVFEAGFALKTHGSLVKGFTPFFAARAGFFLSFKAPASLKFPFFLSCSAATSMMPSTTALTSLLFNPVVSATELYAALAVMADPAAFIAIMAFIAFIATMAESLREADRQVCYREQE